MDVLKVVDEIRQKENELHRLRWVEVVDIQKERIWRDQELQDLYGRIKDYRLAPILVMAYRQYDSLTRIKEDVSGRLTKEIEEDLAEATIAAGKIAEMLREAVE